MIVFNNDSQDDSYSELDPQLHFLGHLSLALSTTCLLESELQFVSGLIMFLPLFYGFLWISYVTKGRRILSTSISNVLGVGISVFGCLWVFSKINQEGGSSLSLPMPTALVPYVGPILAFLVMLRLFGPKGRRDFWILQGMGMLQVSLACVLTTGTFFAFIFSAYMFSLVWILKRYQATRGEVELSTKSSETRPSLRRMGFFPSVGWTVFLGVLSLGLFLITPRTDATSWNPLMRFGQMRGSGGISTGFAEQMNLNKTGEVEVNDEVAMTVHVTDANNKPFSGFSLDQRWRGVVLEHYENGVWNRRISRRVSLKSSQTKLPDFGPNQLNLQFKLIPRRVGGLFIAEPVLFDEVNPDTRLPVLVDPPFHEQLIFYEQGSMVQYSMSVSKIRQIFGYKQVLSGKSQNDKVLASLDTEFLGDLITPKIGALEEWTIGLLNTIKDQQRYGLENVPLPKTFTREQGRPSIESTYRETVARALNSYLSQSGEFTYTLELKRDNPHIDPVVDFLLNVKKGHCERYASGLVLMLRSLGIPSRVIKGFRGCYYEDAGNYSVRNNQAHSWIEVLVPQVSKNGIFLQDPNTGRPLFDWLTLDPTPDSELLENQKFSLLRSIADFIDRAKIFWREMIVDYNAEQQAEFWYKIMPDFTNINLQRFLASLPKIFLGIGFSLLAGVGVVLGLPKLIAGLGSLKNVGRDPITIQYNKLKELALMHLGFSPMLGETPMEFSSKIKTKLISLDLDPELITLPEKIATVLYSIRFGNFSITKRELDRQDSLLGLLSSKLTYPLKVKTNPNNKLPVH